jgi:hypothetical protein
LSSFSSSSISPGRLSAPSQFRSTARRSRASSTPNSDARSTLVSIARVARGAVACRHPVRADGPPAHRRPARRRPWRRLAREDLVQQLARRRVEPQELDAHAVRLLRRAAIERLDPGDLAVARQRDLAARQLDLERERRADRHRRAARDEDAAAGDVRRELVDERIERREAKRMRTGAVELTKDFEYPPNPEVRRQAKQPPRVSRRRGVDLGRGIRAPRQRGQRLGDVGRFVLAPAVGIGAR